ncbi:MAG: DNA methyltransferase [Sandaracinaceae bacterium]
MALEEKLREFAQYAASLRGDEKGEAQIFLERLFQAFGWPGLQEAGAQLETRVPVRIPGRKTTKFADLVWRSDLPSHPGVLIEMKSRGENLEKHLWQVFEYWQHIVPRRPRYTLICNFDEILVYDFDLQLYDPVDRVSIKNIAKQYPALSFLSPTPKKPQFGNDRVAVTRDAAGNVAAAFQHLVGRGVDRAHAQRFILQAVVCMFAEDIDLLPRGLFTELLNDCLEGASTYDAIGDLFRWMNSDPPAKAGRFKGVPYFNGGIFSQVEPLELEREEVNLLHTAAGKNDWSKVQPAIFGTLFQQSMGEEERHERGAHYTSEADIQRVVLPTIVRPWRERIASAKTMEDLVALRGELEKFRVLDPACGSGNFLYVAYRELVRLEMELVHRIRSEFVSARGHREVSVASFVGVKQFFGLDVVPFAAELAKVVLVLAKKLAYDEVMESFRESGQLGLRGLDLEKPLPLDNLDNNIQVADALFTDWPKADVIIGNPPYQSKNKMQGEFGAKYVQRLRKRYPDVPGRADYCVYWFRRAHDALDKGARAGLVGTNTIRQNYSREGSLDYIVDHGGTITEAVGTQVWSGEATVHVSIVNWIKGPAKGKKTLSWQTGDAEDSPWDKAELDVIGPALSSRLDVTSAVALDANASSGCCYQGQTHGHKGFLVPPATAEALGQDKRAREVLFPFLIGRDLLGRPDRGPSRWSIDFAPRDMHAASRITGPFAHIKKHVLPDREASARDEEVRNAEVRSDNPKAKVNLHHQQFLDRWWQFSWPRGELLQRLAGLSRYIVCVRTTKRPVFEFIGSGIRPNDALQVFPLEDDYSFGILQSSVHWKWFVERCSTLKRDFRYTSDTVFDSFAWPQKPSKKDVRSVAEAARALRSTRNRLLAESETTLRAMYRLLDTPGKSELRDAHEALDVAVRGAFGMSKTADPLAFLLDLNRTLAALEKAGDPITGPGIPSSARGLANLSSPDCVPAPTLW